MGNEGKMTKKKILAIVLSCVVVLGVLTALAFGLDASSKASEISIEEAQKTVNEAFDALAYKDEKTAMTQAVKYIADQNEIVVESVSYGTEKDVLLQCTVHTPDIYHTLTPRLAEFLSKDAIKPATGMRKTANDLKRELDPEILKALEGAEMITVPCEIFLYETKEGFVAYTSDSVTDVVYGGVLKLSSEVGELESYKEIGANGEEVEKLIETTNVNKGFIQCFELRRNTQKPDTFSGIGKAWNNLKEDFHKNFIEYGRYKTIFTGLWTTIKLTVCALFIGIILGFIVAFIRCTYLKKPKRSILLRVTNAICQTYLTVIRGTPVVVQIMIIYFVIFMPLGVDKFLASVICFGLNSGAYVAEIVRGGIMSVDDGQTEAGRSLGFGYMPTMWYIIFPQAFKAVLPALANEFVVLLKETSIAFYIGVGDLMYAGNAIRAATYSAFMPLVIVAIIYFVMVLILSKLVSLLERRLRSNER